MILDRVRVDSGCRFNIGVHPPSFMKKSLWDQHFDVWVVKGFFFLMTWPFFRSYNELSGLLVNFEAVIIKKSVL